MAKPSATGGLNGLAQVCREHAAFRPGLANRREHAVPWSFPRVHRREAVLDERAHLRELVLLVGRKILRGKLGVGDDYSLGRPFRERAFTNAKISARPMCPVARIMLCLAISSMQRRAASETLPLESSTVIGGGQFRWPPVHAEFSPRKGVSHSVRPAGLRFR